MNGVPLGSHEGFARDARFYFEMATCGQVLELGDVEYPRVHPPTHGTPEKEAAPAREVLARFLDARLQRQDARVLELLSDELRTRLDAHAVRLTQVSNPCWYRAEVLAFGQATPTTATATIRIYEHQWGGDVAGGLPRSWEQDVRLVQAAAGWRVGQLGVVRSEREEPGEPHGPTTSACTVARQQP